MCLLVLDVTSGNSLYEDEDEFGDSDAEIVTSGDLVLSATRMLGSSLILLLNVLICSSKTYHIAID